MRWVVQDNLFIENRRGDLIEAIERLGLQCVRVNLLEGGRMDKDIPDDDTPTITNGSVALTRLAQARGWTPGGFWSEAFTYACWGTQDSPWHDLLLNANARVGALSDMTLGAESAFVRPVIDTKTFNGQVMTREQFELFQAQSIAGLAGRPAADTPVLIAPVRTIGQEHRHYIVDGQVVTSSRYKLSGQPNFLRGADEVVLDVVRDAIARWTPARAFVLDTYVSGTEIGIVETGCIGNAGLYEADLLKLVNALDSMPMEVAPSAGRRARP